MARSRINTASRLVLSLAAGHTAAAAAASVGRWIVEARWHAVKG